MCVLCCELRACTSCARAATAVGPLDLRPPALPAPPPQRAQAVVDARVGRVLGLERREDVRRGLALGRDERQHEAQQHDARDVEERARLRDECERAQPERVDGGVDEDAAREDAEIAVPLFDCGDG